MKSLTQVYKVNNKPMAKKYSTAAVFLLASLAFSVSAQNSGQTNTGESPLFRGEQLLIATRDWLEQARPSR